MSIIFIDGEPFDLFGSFGATITNVGEIELLLKVFRYLVSLITHILPPLTFKRGKKNEGSESSESCCTGCALAQVFPAPKPTLTPLL